MNLEQLKSISKTAAAQSSGNAQFINKRTASAENIVSRLKAGDSLSFFNKTSAPTASSPFSSGVNAKEVKMDDSNLTSPVAKKFASIADKLDADKNGFVSKKELVNKLNDSDTKDQDAALIGALIKNKSKLAKLSDDETFIEMKGITQKDIIAYDKLDGKSALKEDVDSAYYYYQSKINISKYNKESDGSFQLPKNPSEVNYKDLQQGSAGDCYFLAALASLAQKRPEKIIDMIQDNKNGTYTVKFSDRSVTIKAPTDTELGLYAEGKGWGPIIEKAYAVYRNEKTPFTRLNAFDTSGAGSTIIGRGIKELTGNSFDTDILFSTSKSSTREKLKSATENNKMMVASINKKLFGKESFGLPDGHVYTILNYDSKSDKVTIRNPWGNGEVVNADGSVKDGLDDGIFELSLDDFHKHYTMVSYEK